MRGSAPELHPVPSRGAPRLRRGVGGGVCAVLWAVLPAVLLGGGLAPPRADAHGGQYRAPGGSVPPGLPPATSGTPSLWWETSLDAFAAEGIGPVTTGGGVETDRVKQVIRDDRVVPFLRRVVDGALGSDGDLRGAAAIALAKTTDDPQDVDRLLGLLDERGAPVLLRETSAVAPGLLRRSDPTRQFDGRLLDRVRRRCLDHFDGARASGVSAANRRVRCLAMLSVGLLGDQPVGADDGAHPLDVPSALLSRLRATDDVEESVAILVALGLQATRPPSAEALAVVRTLAGDGAVAGRARGAVVQAHAVLCAARRLGPEASGLPLGLLRTKATPTEVRHAAMAALSELAPRLSPAMRTAAASEVAAHAERGNPESVGAALRALGRIGSAAFADEADRSTLTSPGMALLVTQIERGSSSARRMAAMATGIALRGRPREAIGGAGASFHERAVEALAVSADDAADPSQRAAALIGLGLSRDPAGIPRLLALLGRRDVDVVLRARCATALGLMGDRSAGPLTALRASVAAGSPDEVRRACARALGMLGDATALPVLLEELRADLPDVVRSRSAVAIGVMRRPVAVDPLIALASDARAGDLARAVAVAALGLLCDPERVRSLALLGSDFSGAGVTDALGTALSLL